MESTKYCVLINPRAGNGSADTESRKLSEKYPDCEITYTDMTAIGDYRSFFASLPDGVRVIISGGDGTLNRFVNDTDGIDIRHELYYYATGSGNDFLHDLGKKRGDDPFPVSQYLRDLPVATVKGRRYRFLNDIGFGIDGFCCEEGDKIRMRSDTKPVNYTLIALKGLIYAFKPVNAAVTVDGVTRNYRRVWLAPTMNGRFYGGGMMIAPGQDRLNAEHSVTVVVAHDLGKFKILRLFPLIFKGRHASHTEVLDIITGHSVSVSFDRPTALQIDGETVTGVTGYSVEAGAGIALSRTGTETGSTVR